MARFFESSRIFWNKARSGLPERDQVQETPTRDGKKPREPAVQREQRSRIAADQPGEDRNRRENSPPGRRAEAGAFRQPHVFRHGSVARVFLFGSRTNEPALQQKVDPEI